MSKPLPAAGVLYVFLQLLLNFSVVAARPHSAYYFTGLSTTDGLSSNTVNAILEDSRGFTWFGTPNGLNRYEGTNFTVYRHNSDDAGSIPANEVNALYEDRSGRLWIGTGNGLCYYDAKKDVFVRSAAFTRVAVRSITSDYAGNLWVGSYNDLRIIDRNTGRISVVSVPPEARRQENVWAILSLFEDRNKNMWVGSQVGLYRVDKKGRVCKAFLHDKNDQSSLSSNYVTGITQDRLGNMWFATLEGLNRLKSDGTGFERFRENSAGGPVKGSDIIHVLARAPGDQLWLATEDGLRIMDAATGNFTSIKPDERNTFSLTSHAIKSIHIGKRGIYWFGLYRGGVNRLDENLALFQYQRGNVFDPKGLSSPVVTSFAEHDNGQIFIGTEGGGLQLFDPERRLYEKLNIRSSRQQASRNLAVLSLKKARNGILWIGTNQDGYFQFDPKTRSYKQFLAERDHNTISANVVYCIEQDRKGNIWIGTNGRGVRVFDATSKLLKTFETGSSTSGTNRLPLNGFIRAIAENRSGDMWLASYGSGIAVYHPGRETFSHYRRENTGLLNDHVLTVLHDRRGNTWVGTNGGLSLFDRRKQMFVNYTEAEGLAGRTVFKVLEDGDGKLWLSTDKGISWFDPITRQFKNFGKENKVQDSPFIAGSGITLSSGEIFFGGESGFNYFSPASLPADSYIPPVILTELRVANSVVEPSDGGPINSDINYAEEIVLSYGQNFSISYVALNYSNPSQNRYAYQLVGFDADWNYVESMKTAYYTNLDPGEYTFRVRASNADGVWDKESRSIVVRVLPPWWRTVYAYLLYLFVAGTGLYYLRKNSLRKIRMEVELEQEKLRAEEQIRQERREAERLQELNLMKIKFLTNLSHEFRTPVSLILAPVEKMLAHVTDSSIIGQATMIKRNAKRLLNLVNQLLDFRKMEEQELRLNLSSGDLLIWIREATDSFHDLSERKNIRFSIYTEMASLPACFDHDKVERIIFNLLSNAFKFTLEGGEISMHLYLLEEEDGQRASLCMQVSDTGIGIPGDRQEKIFERFFQYDNAESVLSQGSGIGLSITREFVVMHGGDISVKSEQNVGTTFTVVLPVIPPGSAEIIGGTNVTAEAPIAPEMTVRKDVGKLPVLLLVEDNEDFRFYLKENLKLSYHIIEACNGKEGWQKTLALHPELVVSDISMPYMNGFDLSRKIKGDKRTKHIPVILLTALAAEEEQIRGLESGANDYLTKPFNFEILQARLKNALSLNRSLKNTYTKQIRMVGQDVDVQLRDAKLLSRIHGYIEQKLTDRSLSVEELSKHVGMSRASLYHKVLELTGLSPVEYIRSVKLDKAAALLEKSDLNVSEVAYMTGFGTPNYFARMFKARFNLLPSEYANEKRKAGTEFRQQ